MLEDPGPLFPVEGDFPSRLFFLPAAFAPHPSSRSDMDFQFLCGQRLGALVGNAAAAAAASSAVASATALASPPPPPSHDSHAPELKFGGSGPPKFSTSVGGG
ncbi:hypothetical protein J437_LFUL007139 [Ladona fulva]|uniref:Uncharacterized protein n=1 Tax=Ladona fulva TaxID=123851 RepID=A0A8K0K7Y5_LADFU|nr:hypothetical protein J437_LFUL007139 [Ladona fulva]